MNDETLEKAIAAVGSMSELARRLKIYRSAVAQWEQVPAERVLAVEAAAGGAVSCHDLRPDIYPRENQL